MDSFPLFTMMILRYFAGPSTRILHLNFIQWHFILYNHFVKFKSALNLGLINFLITISTGTIYTVFLTTSFCIRRAQRAYNPKNIVLVNLKFSIDTTVLFPR